MLQVHELSAFVAHLPPCAMQPLSEQSLESQSEPSAHATDLRLSTRHTHITLNITALLTFCNIFYHLLSI